MNPDSKKFIAVVAGSVIILIAVFVFVLMQLLAPKEVAPGQTVSAFPDSSERTDLGPVGDEAYIGFESSTTSGATETVVPNEEELVDTATIPEALQNRGASDWRDPVVNYGGGQTATVDTNNPIAINDRPTQSIDDLVANGLVLDYDMYNTLIPTPDTFTLGDGREISMDALKDPEAFFKAVNPIPSLVDVFADVKSCGTLQVPGSESGAKQFFSNLSEYEEAACLGEAIVNGCEPAWALINSPDIINTWVYVGERPDGVCGTGITHTQGYVNMCDLAEAANSATNKNLSLKEWQLMYAENPAELFAKIYNSESVISELSNLDCTKVQVK